MANAFGRVWVVLVLDIINSVGSNRTQPADLAVLAMTLYQLGQLDAARATLARLRESVQQKPRWANDADAQAFLREAEALMEGDAAKPKE